MKIPLASFDVVVILVIAINLVIVSTFFYLKEKEEEEKNNNNILASVLLKILLKISFLFSSSIIARVRLQFVACSLKCSDCCWVWVWKATPSSVASDQWLCSEKAKHQGMGSSSYEQLSTD